MNKDEIMVDDVNVAGCEFYDNGCCRECDMRVPFYGDIDCDDKCNKDCYYKQLKRLEKENEELQHKCEVYHQCDEMVKNTYGQAHKEAIRLAKENDKYKHALEQIREISKPVDELCRNCEHDRFLCDNECECNAYRLEQVQNKINEALESEEN